MKRIFTTLSDKWPEYLLEILVITIGILGAFALSNWNERLNDNKRSDQLIKRLHVEFTINQNKINSMIERQENVAKSATALIQIINANQPLSDDSLKYHWTTLAVAYTFDPQNSVLESAVSSGEVHLLDNEILLDHLFQWENLTQDVKEEENRAKQQVHADIVPFSFQYVMESELISDFFESIYNQGMISSDQEIHFKSRYKSDFKGLVFNREFENMISLRLENMLDVLAELRPIQEKNQLILAELEKVLDN